MRPDHNASHPGVAADHPIDVIRTMTGGATKMRGFIVAFLSVAIVLVSVASVGSIAVAESTAPVSGCIYTDNGTPIGGAHVTVCNWDTNMFAGEGWTNDNGAYIISGLVLARYRVKADAAGYFPEYYLDGGQSPVTVVPPYPTDNIDFALTPGSSISGHVYQSDGLTAIGGARVAAYTEVAGAWACVATQDADSNGGYSITIESGEGTYRLRAQAPGFAAAYYSSAPDCASASEIEVTEEGNVPGIDFRLAESGFISGTVYMADGFTPMYGVNIAAYDNATGDWVDEGLSGSNSGRYYINLPPGTYRLKAEAPSYLWEWHENATCFGDATPISVDGLNERSDTNFTLQRVLGVTTGPAVSLTTTSVRLWGDVTSLGAEKDVTVSFVWGTEAGSYPHETPRWVRDSKGPTPFELSGLAPGKTYFYRFKAAGNAYSVYGGERSFTTDDDTAPIVSRIRFETTASVTTITWTTNEAATSRIDFGPTRDYEETTGPSAEPATSHTVCLTALSPDTAYHCRIICWDTSHNKTETRDYTFTTEAYYAGMATTTWRIIGFAVVVGVAIATSLIWIRTRTKETRASNPESSV